MPTADQDGGAVHEVESDLDNWINDDVARGITAIETRLSAEAKMDAYETP